MMEETQASTLPNIGELRQAIRAEYSAVAAEPSRGFHFHTGRKLAGPFDNKESWFDGIPEGSIESFAGTGNPLLVDRIARGEGVVDVGCGAGLDTLIAAKAIGPTGSVLGFDMTPEMWAKAGAAKERGGFTNVEIRERYGEALPIDDNWADLIISNGALSLMPNKDAALREMACVFTPGGRLQIADIIVERAVPDDAKRDIDLWTGWIAGALLDVELEERVSVACFQGFEITGDDVFEGAPRAGSAAKFGTLGITFRARNPL